jgi:hypothetical protein
MSDSPKTKAEFITLIEDVKRLELQRLESIRELRCLADSTIANPATPPEAIAAIEEQFETIQAANLAHRELMRIVAARYSELEGAAA